MDNEGRSETVPYIGADEISGQHFAKMEIVFGIQGLINISGIHFRSEVVTVYLKNSASPYAIVDSSTSTLDSITLKGTFGFLPSVNSGGSYYIEVKHKNSIETWSSTPISFTGDSASL